MRTNRQRVIEAIRRRADKRLDTELEYQIEANADEAPTYDLAEALWDALRFSEYSRDRVMRRACVDVLIEAGYLSPRAADTEVAVLGRDPARTRDGVLYDENDAGWDSWITKGDER